MDDKEFVAQLAQFSLIDTLQEVKKALSGTQLAQASGLIGGHVQGMGVDGQPVAGIVDRLVQDDKGMTLIVGGRGIRPENVTVVTAP
jgi:flagellar hook assembly protein FlgD